MTYLDLAGGALACVVVLHVVCVIVAHRRGTLPRSFATAVIATVLALCVLTVVFDSLMVMADLFRFDESQLTGVRVWRAPLEDLAWPLAAGLALPALRVALTPVRRAAPAGGRGIATPDPQLQEHA